MRAGTWAIFLICAAAAPARAQPASQLPSLEHLLAYENRILRGAEKTPRPDVDARFGGDPFKIMRLPDGGRFLTLLRNRAQILLTDGSLNLLSTHPAPVSPTGWTLADDGNLFICGERSAEIYHYKIAGGEMRLQRKLRLENGVGVRDLVYVPGSRSLFLLDAFDRRLHQWIFPAGWPQRDRFAVRRRNYPLGAGAVQIRHLGNHLIVNLFLEHSLQIIPLRNETPDFARASRLVHDGPIWNFDAIVRDDSLMIAAAGIEDQPLNRSGGEFGHIDSFLFLYRVPRQSAAGIFHWRPEYRRQPHRYAAENLSMVDVVTPKAVRFEVAEDGAAALWVAAFGSSRIARFDIRGAKLALGATVEVPPGTTDFIVLDGERSKPRLFLTNSLFDRLYQFEAGSWSRIAGVPDYPAQIPRASRVGELLFFTTLMAPHNRSKGSLSRFTCEACHFEGGGDGRVHYAGRNHVFAATKPLRGLANNVPLFSRAGDKSLASMVLAEFRVANQGRRDAFAIEIAKFPWLEEIEGIGTTLSATELREALVSFFVDFEHAAQPLRAQTRGLSPRAAKGLEIFRERCEYCHLATASTRSERSLPYEDWRSRFDNNGPDLVWGAPFYTKTGIEPYVHRAGVRVPSLRRIGQKYPYFTNGSSRTLHHLLSRFRYRGLTAWHHYEKPAEDSGSDEVKTLSAEEIALLEELLRYF